MIFELFKPNSGCSDTKTIIKILYRLDSQYYLMEHSQYSLWVSYIFPPLITSDLTTKTNLHSSCKSARYTPHPIRV